MTGTLLPDDVVGVDHMGRHFMALVVSVNGAEVKVKPLTHNVNYYTIKKRDVQTRWRLSKGPVPSVKPGGGIVYG